MSDMDGYRAEGACPQCQEVGGCPCLTDADAPETCDHGKTVGEFCAGCDVSGEGALAVAAAKALERIGGAA